MTDARADQPGTKPAASNLVEYSVSELAFALKRTVEDAYGLVRLKGEISGFRGQHNSGHCYFTLKDDKACIEAVVWRSTYQRLKHLPEEGMEVVATGRITTYPDRSKYQIVIDKLEPAGIGALLAQFEKRKRQLAAEGLFDAARKRELPYLPRIVGVVTSPTGAVIRDILHRLADRFPCHVLVWPVRVQGETCHVEVSGAIHGFNALMIGGPVPRPDLIIVARGGGSLEDLWGFNEESVVRAVAASTIPLISAVGHETDWTLIDLVADFRAPTPSAAAERAVPVRAELTIKVTGYGLRAATQIRGLLESRAGLLQALARGLPRRSDILALPRQRFDGAASRLGRALHANAHAHRVGLANAATRLRPHLVRALVRGARDRLTALDGSRGRALKANAHAHRVALASCSERLRPHLVQGLARGARGQLSGLERGSARAFASLVARRRERLDARGALLGSLGHRNVLARGFALVRDADGAMIRRVAEVSPGMRLDIEFADGHVGARADAGEERKPAPRRQGSGGGGNQGTLL